MMRIANTSVGLKSRDVRSVISDTGLPKKASTFRSRAPVKLPGVSERGVSMTSLIWPPLLLLGDTCALGPITAESSLEPGGFAKTFGILNPTPVGGIVHIHSSPYPTRPVSQPPPVLTATK